MRGALPKDKEGGDGEGERAARELIVGDEREYEEAAARLANGLRYVPKRGRSSSSSGAGGGGGGGGGMSGWGNEYEYWCEGVGRLAELRKLLWENKWTCALFDTRRWVRDLEEAYEIAWGRWVSGESGDIYL